MRYELQIGCKMMPMNKLVRDDSSKTLFRFVIFVSYIIGIITARRFFPIFNLEEELAQKLLLSSVPLALALIFSSSILGLLLLPACAFFFGSVSLMMADSMIAEYLSGSYADIKGLLIFLISVPVFFIVSVNGMETSKILLSTLCGGSSSVKNAYNREYIPMTIAVIAAVLAVCFITG